MVYGVFSKCQEHIVKLAMTLKIHHLGVIFDKGAPLMHAVHDIMHPRRYFSFRDFKFVAQSHMSEQSGRDQCLQSYS